MLSFVTQIFRNCGRNDRRLNTDRILLGFSVCSQEERIQTCSHADPVWHWVSDHFGTGIECKEMKILVAVVAWKRCNGYLHMPV